MTLSKKLRRDLEDAALMIEMIDWRSFTEDGQGACIPISYCISRFLAIRRRPNRIAECTLEARDPRNARTLEIKPDGKTPFLGHVIVLLPPQERLLDGSLWTQPSKVLANAEIPSIVVAPWRKGLPTYTKLGQVEVKYEVDLRAYYWKTKHWPWTQLADATVKIERALR